MLVCINYWEDWGREIDNIYNKWVVSEHTQHTAHSTQYIAVSLTQHLHRAFVVVAVLASPCADGACRLTSRPSHLLLLLKVVVKVVTTIHKLKGYHQGRYYNTWIQIVWCSTPYPPSCIIFEYAEQPTFNQWQLNLSCFVPVEFQIRNDCNLSWIGYRYSKSL